MFIIILRWTSETEKIPKGSLKYQNLPKVVAKVHPSELCSSSLSCQNPFEQFIFENILDPDILAISFSFVDSS